MTYCVGLRLNRGLLFMADTRTNAGLDNISTYRKLFSWSDDGDSAITLLTAGNLATTQAVVSLIEERMKAPGERSPSILGLPSMFQVARFVGQLLKDVIAQNAQGGQRADSTFNATLIVGGQVKGSEPRLFLIYPEGNFIEAGLDTPFLQIGETKYGRPILVRAFDPDMTLRPPRNSSSSALIPRSRPTSRSACPSTCRSMNATVCAWPPSAGSGRTTPISRPSLSAGATR